MKKLPLIYTLALAAVITGCDSSDNPNSTPPPIKMGDPATIVTETDSQYLADVVGDLNMTNRPVAVTTASPATDTTAKNADTAKPAVSQTAPQQQTAEPAKPAAAATGKGLNVPFPQVRFFIPGIETKTYKAPNLETDYGASYELTSGDLADNQIVVEGKNIEAVYMRYQTIIVARNKNGTLPLESLRKLTDWKKMKGKNNSYRIEGLDKKKLESLKVSNKAIRNAVTRDARARRLSRNATQQWMTAVRNTNSTSQKPLSVELRSVMFKVTGKDANGRPYQRQLRIDIPVQG